MHNRLHNSSPSFQAGPRGFAFYYILFLWSVSREAMGYNIGCLRAACSPSLILAMVMSCVLPSSLAFLTPSPVSSAIGSSFSLRGTQPGMCPRVGSLVAAASSRQSQAGRISLAPRQLVMQTETVAHGVEKVKKRTIVVAGASGRVGSAVVKQLLERQPTWTVVAGVRNLVRADDVLGDLKAKHGDRLRIVACNLEKRKDVSNLVFGVDQVIWCASGFSGRSQGRFKRLAFLGRVIRFAAWKKIGKVLDQRGPMRMAQELQRCGKTGGVLCKHEGTEVTLRDPLGNAMPNELLPRFIMLSSAAVTRPSWSDDRKRAFPEASSIPIVKLNPLGLLDVKLKGEMKMRQTGAPYTIVRSCGINATHPDGAVKISTGDTAVGRVNPQDLAKILITMLDSTEATGKTFEVYTTEKETSMFGLMKRSGIKGDCVNQLSLLPRDEPLPARKRSIGSIGSVSGSSR